MADQLLTVPTSLIGQNMALWTLKSANMNSTADQAFAKAFGFTTFTIDKIIVTNASASLTLAAGGLYGAAAKGAPILVAATQLYSGLTGPTGVLNPGLQAAANNLLSLANIYLSLTTGQGGAATADIYIMGEAWS